MYLLSGISKRVYDPNEILFDKAQKVKNSDIKKKNLQLYKNFSIA